VALKALSPTLSQREREDKPTFVGLENLDHAPNEQWLLIYSGKDGGVVF
jgi:hypothetical protein